MIGTEEESDPELSQCFGGALGRVVWPQGAKGNAVWSFSVLRQEQP